MGSHSHGERVESLRHDFDARAAGLWRVEGGELVQLGFAAAPDMPLEVASGFAEATRQVSLSRADLGIVVAFTRGEPVESRAIELAPDAGSGHWLRAFGAARSIAVPLVDDRGATVGVVAVATLADVPPAQAMAARLREAGRGWIESP